MDENEVPEWIEAEQEIGNEPLLEYPPHEPSESPPQDSDDQDAAPPEEWGDWWEVWEEEGESGPPTWRPTRVGESLAGVVIEKMVAETPFGECPVVEINDQDRGPMLLFCGTFSIKRDLFEAGEIGQSVHVKYLGDRRSSMGRRYRAYDVRLTGTWPDI